ncbi:heavy metal translocating P-type ATPase [Ligilactobacillus cholophilus]|uniref:heavy metal translocating P-type ATPase n=1 Tax=Ligilactobacillus cholophilus TaxID=3050131 RepID=UPI0025B0EABA|nr:heavy metal translocating P-type ATPase [Ligilactobacillus cholophilus]
MKLKKLTRDEYLAIIQIIASAVLTVIASLTPYSLIQIGIYIIAYLIVGFPVLKEAISNLFHGDLFDENFLMMIATLGAMLMKQFPEAVMVILLYEIGEFFQDQAIKSSQSSVTDLLDNRPEKTIRLKDGHEEEILSEDVKLNDILIIKPGDKVPVDGTIVSGEADVDTAALTGESVPRHLVKGDQLLSGMIVEDSVLKIIVTHTYGDSTVAKILNLVENAASRKAKTENFITKFSRIYTPIVVLAALLLAVIPPIVLHQGFHQWISRALIFLVISCPCALVISVPLSYFSGIGAASRIGALVKGSNYLEALTQIKGAMFDKTGTLTRGKFSVVQIEPQEGFSEEKILHLAALVEQHSPHPIAQAIVNCYPGHLNSKVKCVKEVAGLGIKADINGNEVMVGNAKMMKKYHVKNFKKCCKDGTVVNVAVDGRFLGFIEVADTIKKTSKQAVEGLYELGIDDIVMLTGDSKKISEKIAKKIGINEVKADLMPQDKVKAISDFQQTHPDEKLVFVGDGLNDTPSLASADVGVAMGALGSDAAVEAADVVLVHDDPLVLPNLIKIACKTKTIVYQNIAISLTMKVLFLILGAWGLTTMWEAVFADVGITLIAVINSLRLLRKPIKKVNEKTTLSLE